MNDKNKKLVFLMNALSLINGNYDDFLITGDDKLLGYSMELLLEIQELIEEGYTKDEIRGMIIQTNFRKNDNNISEWEEEMLKKDALFILDIRYEIWLKNKHEKKLKKTC